MNVLSILGWVLYGIFCLVVIHFVANYDLPTNAYYTGFAGGEKALKVEDVIKKIEELIENPELLVTDEQYQSVLACANNHLHWVVEQDPSANDCSTGEPDEVGKGRTTKELYIVMNNEVVSKGR